jgi:hypothetical protein
MLRLTMLPAGKGDALWIEWGDSQIYRILIDLGTGKAGAKLRQKLEVLPEKDRHFELLVVTHVDEDHIGGVLKAIVDQPLSGLSFGDVWFNGWKHLVQAAAELDTYGAYQGELLTRWLESQPWNRAFGEGPVRLNDPPTRVELADGLTLTVLGPPTHRLADYRSTWRAEVLAAIAKGRLDADAVALSMEELGLETMGALVLSDRAALRELATKATRLDDSKANASSINLLLEYRGHRLLLSGDAFAEDIVTGLATLGDSPAVLTAFKLPHHASHGNVTRGLIEAVHCEDWLISTNGDQHGHPNVTAIARVLHHTIAERTHLHFNVRSDDNAVWDRNDWRQRFSYDTHYGDNADGLTLQLD